MEQLNIRSSVFTEKFDLYVKNKEDVLKITEESFLEQLNKLDDHYVNGLALTITDSNFTYYIPKLKIFQPTKLFNFQSTKQHLNKVQQELEYIDKFTNYKFKEESVWKN